MKFVAPLPDKVNNAFNLALFALREQALMDCNYFVRVDQGIFRDSAKADIDGNTLTISWDTPYAKRVYYTGTPSTDVNENASLMWADKAAAEFGESWIKILDKGMKDNL